MVGSIKVLFSIFYWSNQDFGRLRRDLMAIRKPELGCFPDSFSGHWSRNRVPTCHFFHRVSGFRTTATLWASGIRILVPNRVNEIEPNISTTIEQKKILKVLMVK